MARPLGPRTIGVFLLALLAWSGPGCAGGNRSARAVELFQQREYEGALQEASLVARSSAGADAERARLIAGMSAYELKRYEEADRWLRPLTASENSEVAGKAYATLGLALVKRDRFSTASIDLASAARKLSGNDAAQANFFAGECHTIMGRLEPARRHYTLALASATDPGLRSRISSRLASGDYTVQVGAFSRRENAERALAAAQARAQALGLPPARIVSHEDITGRTIHLVQIGRYTQKSEAQMARARYAGDSVVVPARGR